jgi:hypothetical protein
MTPKREQIITQLLERYTELADPMQSGNGGGDTGLRLMPRTYTPSVRELERLMVQLREERHNIWWHVNERYLKAVQRPPTNAPNAKASATRHPPPPRQTQQALHLQRRPRPPHHLERTRQPEKGRPRHHLARRPMDTRHRAHAARRAQDRGMSTIHTWFVVRCLRCGHSWDEDDPESERLPMPRHARPQVSRDHYEWRNEHAVRPH